MRRSLTDFAASARRMNSRYSSFDILDTPACAVRPCCTQNSTISATRNISRPLERRKANICGVTELALLNGTRGDELRVARARGRAGVRARDRLAAPVLLKERRTVRPLRLGVLELRVR